MQFFNFGGELSPSETVFGPKQNNMCLLILTPLQKCEVSGISEGDILCFSTFTLRHSWTLEGGGSPQTVFGPKQKYKNFSSSTNVQTVKEIERTFCVFYTLCHSCILKGSCSPQTILGLKQKNTWLLILTRLETFKESRKLERDRHI